MPTSKSQAGVPSIWFDWTIFLFVQIHIAMLGTQFYLHYKVCSEFFYGIGTTQHKALIAIDLEFKSSERRFFESFDGEVANFNFFASLLLFESDFPNENWNTSQDEKL